MSTQRRDDHRRNGELDCPLCMDRSGGGTEEGLNAGRGESRGHREHEQAQHRARRRH
jgi:hypothetical protein